ncbi:hypothetical protein ACQP1W_43040 [Spirillospora sp. CA-255316]
MKSWASARLAVLAATAAAAMTAAPPASAADGRIEFSYSPPELSQSGDQVIWRWTVHNTGDRPANGVVLFHTLRPNLKVTSISPPCKAHAGTIRCDYRLLGPGEKQHGTLMAELPAHVTGLVQIRGRVTWQLPAAPAADATPLGPESSTPSSGGAMPPERDESPQPRPNGSATAKRSALITTWRA